MNEEWISVVDRLPEPGTHVLIWWDVDISTKHLLAYLGDDGEWRSGFEDALIAGVTYWRPLPAAPDQ